MFERFTERARQVVVLAQDEARLLQHNYIGTEHLLLGLLREEEGLAAHVLDSLGITAAEARAQVARVVGRGDEVSTGQIPFTPRSKKVLELALREALSLGHNYIGTEHILLGLVRENQGVAARILLDFDADAEKVRNQVIRKLEVKQYTPPSNLPVPSLRPLRHRFTQWDYRVVSLPATASGRQEELTDLGGQGWQLVTVAPGADGLQWILQRPTPPRPRPGSGSHPGPGGRRPEPIDEETRGRTISQLRAAIEAAKQRASAADDAERVSVIDDLADRFDRLIVRIVKDDSVSAGDDPDAALEVGELVAQIEEGTLTVGEAIDFVRRSKEAAIEAASFEQAVERRELERRLEALIREIGRVLRETSPPPGQSDQD